MWMDEPARRHGVLIMACCSPYVTQCGICILMTCWPSLARCHHDSACRCESCWRICDHGVTWVRCRLAKNADSEMRKLVGGPGFEPGASRSRALVTACPPASYRVLRCPPELRTRSLFFFNDTATTEVYTLSLHDALPT